MARYPAAASVRQAGRQIENGALRRKKTGFAVVAAGNGISGGDLKLPVPLVIEDTLDVSFQSCPFSAAVFRN